MLDVSGQNADEFFEDIGHSTEARKELQKHLIGTYKFSEEELENMRLEAEKKAAGGPGFSTLMIVVIAIIIAYFGYSSQ